MRGPKMPHTHNQICARIGPGPSWETARAGPGQTDPNLGQDPARKARIEFQETILIFNNN